MPQLLTIFIVCLALSLGLLCCLLWILSRQKYLKRTINILEADLKEERDKSQYFLSELTEIKNQVNKTILHDSLTGLPSRPVFEDRLTQTLNQSERYQLIFGILAFSMDGFKMINDALGYEIGDEILKEVAVRIERSIRRVDTVSRFAGDTFVILLPQQAKAESCVYVAQRLLTVISEPFHIQEKELFLTASIGIAVYPGDGSDAKTLLKNADSALHQAESRGCNSYQFYHENMQTLSHRELMLQSGLRDSTVYSDFSVYYQPQINTETKEVVCMEALLRWQHPTFGLIAPYEFLRMLESSGKILPIGEWVFRTVCTQFKEWKAKGFPLEKVSVNVSFRQLENPHFIYKISQILQETGIEAKCLVLEISEIMLVEKLETLEKTLQLLKHLGVRLAIDDFGTGHISLLQLQSFRADYLKIDGSLIQQMTIHQEAQAIIKMIVTLAQGLHFTVIAEGVETHQQKEMLEQMGCHIMQGYFFSVPRKPEEFTDATSLEKMVR